MTPKTEGAEHTSAKENSPQGRQDYIRLFEAAFDELHSKVVRQIRTPGQYLGAHFDYPDMSLLDSGFPSFHNSYLGSARRNYVDTVRPTGIIGLFSGQKYPEIAFPKGDELARFLRNHDVGKRLAGLTLPDGTVSNVAVEHLVNDAVERYLHLHGLDYAINSARRRAVILPLVSGTISPSLYLRLVVPITMTHFDVDHFRLTETAYITRLPKKMQLARNRINNQGSGAGPMVVGAATHAFVSIGWRLRAGSTETVKSTLRQVPANVVDDIDTFFGALRVASGIRTGYAQILWVPRQWALDYFCDLTPVYGATLRQYPSEFDNYAWMRKGSTVRADQLNEVRRIYRAAVESRSEALRLALKRLNGCLTRTDAADAILDGTIGLEILLGDDQNQSLAYKLRLRAGALAILQGELTPVDVASKVKRLYGARSAIVHGLRKKRSKIASGAADTAYSDERMLASDLLRFAIDVLLTHPKYQDPAKIDEDLLLGHISPGNA